jgi:hypothetical protein
MLWVLCAIAALAIGAASILVGVNILPGFGKAVESGTVIPLLVAWSVAGTAVVAALLLARFLLSQRSRA